MAVAGGGGGTKDACGGIAGDGGSVNGFGTAASITTAARSGTCADNIPAQGGTSTAGGSGCYGTTYGLDPSGSFTIGGSCIFNSGGGG